MHREYQRWYSPSVERDMELLVFGHGGARVLVFPSSFGRFYEWENQGMIAALGGRLERGDFQLFCMDGIDTETWYARDRSPAERLRRYEQYGEYVLGEVLPFSAGHNDNPFVVVTGTSLGAYHAVNFAFRHPEEVNRVLGMSGKYDIRGFLNGYYSDAVYFNNPCDYLGNEHDPDRLAALRRLDVILATGRDDPNRASSEYLSGILWGKGVWHALQLWDGWAHDWPYWQKMVQLYIGGHD
jgi:esterase/lipase superfamily enzyme